MYYAVIELTYQIYFLSISIILSIIIGGVSYFISARVAEYDLGSAYECGFEPFEKSHRPFKGKFIYRVIKLQINIMQNHLIPHIFTIVLFILFGNICGLLHYGFSITLCWGVTLVFIIYCCVLYVFIMFRMLKLLYIRLSSYVRKLYRSWECDKIEREALPVTGRRLTLYEELVLFGIRLLFIGVMMLFFHVGDVFLDFMLASGAAAIDDVSKGIFGFLVGSIKKLLATSTAKKPWVANSSKPRGATNVIQSGASKPRGATNVIQSGVSSIQFYSEKEIYKPLSYKAIQIIVHVCCMPVQKIPIKIWYFCMVYYSRDIHSSKKFFARIPLFFPLQCYETLGLNDITLDIILHFYFDFHYLPIRLQLILYNYMLYEYENAGLYHIALHIGFIIRDLERGIVNPSVNLYKLPHFTLCDVRAK